MPQGLIPYSNDLPPKSLCSFEQTAVKDPAKISENRVDVMCFTETHPRLRTMDNIQRPAEPKPALMVCAITELLEIAQRQGITPADFIQLLDSGMRVSDF